MEATNFSPRPWQVQAAALLADSGERAIIWLVDANGCSGKTEFLKYLEHSNGFQYIPSNCLADQQGNWRMMRVAATGYAIDMSRDPICNMETHARIYDFMEQIKNGRIQSVKYNRPAKILSSNKLVIAANYMPNLCTISIDRWKIFHTELGLVHIKCEPNGTNRYKCSISNETSRTLGVDYRSLPSVVNIKDKDFFNQYLKIYLDKQASCLLTNSLAFPKIENEHKIEIRRLVRQCDRGALLHYIVEHDLFQNSITSVNAFLAVLQALETAIPIGNAEANVDEG